MIGRREFLGACAGIALLPLLRGTAVRAASALPAALLESSPFVYISPLLADGRESTCHSEVWYGWIDGAVVINTAPTTWKSRALAKGRDRARIWVGDHGRVKQMIGSNDAFRSAPHFDARAESVKNGEALLDRLLAVYEKKYPREIANWRDKMRSGYKSGDRLLLRYTPV
ncbi:MAG TPA: hypothetical protein VKH41_04825 [Myxococcota bacterium]|nr:hypothetical protein [Myxococcota bacterium]